MKGVVITALALAFVAYVVVQIGNMYRAKEQFAKRIEDALDSVDEDSVGPVRQRLVQEARQLGITLGTEDILVVYAKTDQLTLPQQIVAGGLPVQFTNRRVEITAHYVARVFGIPFNHDITRSRIKQVRAPRMEMRSEYKQLLEETDR